MAWCRFYKDVASYEIAELAIFGAENAPWLAQFPEYQYLVGDSNFIN